MTVPGPGPDPQRRPEIPLPLAPPIVPAVPAPPVLVPGVAVPGPPVASSPYEDLYRRRTVFLQGPLEHETATALAAQLMALDGQSDAEVVLVVTSPGGQLPPVLAVADTVGLMRAPVRTICVGQALGTAAVVVALGTGRREATAGARLSLRLDLRCEVSGGAQEVRQAAEQALALERQLAAMVAGRIRRSADEVQELFRKGPFWTAGEALAAGVIDAIAERPSARPPTRPGRD